jgi:hypothetical protein
MPSKTTMPSETTMPSKTTMPSETTMPSKTTMPSETTSPSETTMPSITQTPTDPPSDYTVPYTQLQIYKMYNSATGYSSTSNTNIYKMMDASYGILFDTSQIGNMTEENIAKLWNANKSIQIDDALFNASNYFIIQSSLSNRKCVSSDKNGVGLSTYFLNQIQNNKGSSSILLSLKNAYYAIVKPRFLVNTLSNVYWQNVKSLTNSDKGTYNSIIFVLNTCAELATTNTLSRDLSENDVAKIISKDTPFTIDSLWLYQLTSIAFEIGRFSANFQVSGNGNPAITTTIGKFKSGYPKYLQKINQVESISPLVFMSENIPNVDECSAINIIASHFISGINN